MFVRSLSWQLTAFTSETATQMKKKEYSCSLSSVIAPHHLSHQPLILRVFLLIILQPPLSSSSSCLQLWLSITINPNEPHTTRARCDKTRTVLQRFLMFVLSLSW